jgi:hypothetical protein
MLNFQCLNKKSTNQYPGVVLKRANPPLRITLD